jgi:predicted outer membrane repeat protein
VRRRTRKLASLIGACALVAGGLLALASTPAGATTVSTEAELDTAFSNAAETQIDLANSITLTCATAELSRSSATGLVIDGHGFTITQTCPGERVMDQGLNGLLDLRNVTVTGGDAVGLGGGIRSEGPVAVTNSVITGNDASNGGGIRTPGNLTMTNSTLSGNTATGDSGGAFVGGTSVITGSTISGNTAAGPGGGLVAGGLATITNSTISGNTANQGGGVYAQGRVVLEYATVVENTAGTGANLEFTDTDLMSFGSVVARPLGGGGNCVNLDSTTSNGYNFEDTNTCGFGSGTGDQTNAGDPQLGALGNNGGPTPTMAPAAGSGLVDKIPALSPCGGVNITVDQRGLPRPVTAGQFCDIGAFEIQVAALEVEITFTG